MEIFFAAVAAGDEALVRAILENLPSETLTQFASALRKMADGVEEVRDARK